MKGWAHILSSRCTVPVVGGLLLLVYFVSAITADLKKSATFDETLYMATGYTYWTRPDYSRIYPDAGIMGQSWAAFPLVFKSLKFPELDEKRWNKADNFAIGYAFLYLLGNPGESMLWQARAMIALLGVGLGAIVFAWSRKISGDYGGLISLALFSFSPSMLAHGTLVTADLAVTLGFLAATWTLWRVTHEVNLTTVLASIAALSFLMMSKMSGVVIIPVFGLILLVRTISTRPIRIGSGSIHRRLSRLAFYFALALVQAAGVICVMWIVYNFGYSRIVMDEWRDQIARAGISGIAMPGGLKNFILHCMVHCGLFPPAYVEGFVFSMRFTEARLAFLNGHYSIYGWWWFFPYAFLVKTPLPTLILMALAPVAWFHSRKRRSTGALPVECPWKAAGLYELAPLLILAGVYAVIAITSTINIGHRYILPVYPPLFILAGMNACWLKAGNRLGQIVVVGLLVCLVAVSFSIRPDYLAYFNSLSGGPREGYRHLVDSSLDWGQDLPGLKTWISKNCDENREAIYLSYFGTARPEYYDIHALQLPSCNDQWRPRVIYPLKGGVYCISATMFEGMALRCFGRWCEIYESTYHRLRKELKPWYENDPEARLALIKENGEQYWSKKIENYEQLRFARLCAHLRHREPDAEVGYSILIYRMSDAEVVTALDERPAELLKNQENIQRNSF